MSSTQEIQSGLAEILEEVAGVTPADATPEKSFTDDLDVDSLSMVEIATAVEDKFGVAIPDDELGQHQDRRRRDQLHREEPGLTKDPPRPRRSRRDPAGGPYPAPARSPGGSP